MKKKLGLFLAVCMLCVGFTACGSSKESTENGERVTAEEWVQAWNATRTLDNFSAKVTVRWDFGDETYDEQYERSVKVADGKVYESVTESKNISGQETIREIEYYRGFIGTTAYIWERVKESDWQRSEYGEENVAIGEFVLSSLESSDFDFIYDYENYTFDKKERVYVLTDSPPTYGGFTHLSIKIVDGYICSIEASGMKFGPNLSVGYPGYSPWFTESCQFFDIGQTTVGELPENVE